MTVAVDQEKEMAEFGYGTANPKLWGQKPKKEKKRK